MLTTFVDKLTKYPHNKKLIPTPSCGQLQNQKETESKMSIF